MTWLAKCSNEHVSILHQSLQFSVNGSLVLCVKQNNLTSHTVCENASEAELCGVNLWQQVLRLFLSHVNKAHNKTHFWSKSYSAVLIKAYTLVSENWKDQIYLHESYNLHNKKGLSLSSLATFCWLAHKVAGQCEVMVLMRLFCMNPAHSHADGRSDT